MSFFQAIRYLNNNAATSMADAILEGKEYAALQGGRAPEPEATDAAPETTA